MLVVLVDRVLKLLDSNAKQAILLTMVDWKSAFDLQDPTLAIKKFVKMGGEVFPSTTSY